MKKTAVAGLLTVVLVVAATEVGMATHGGPFGTVAVSCGSAAGSGTVGLNGMGGEGYGKVRANQTFTPPRTGRMRSVKLFAFRRQTENSTPMPDVIVEIREVDPSGLPTNETLASAIIPGEDVFTNGGLHDIVANFRRADAPVLLARQMYTLSVTLEEIDHAEVSWRLSSAACPGGRLYYEDEPYNDTDATYEIYLDPSNDQFAHAQKIWGTSATVPGTTAAATRETNEPDHLTSGPDADDWQGDHTVWYEWTAQAPGPVTVDVCDANVDSILAVYRTATGPGALDLVTDNNNSPECAPGTFGSLATFDAVKGQTYNIVVGDAGAARENLFTLALSANTAPTITPKSPAPGSEIASRTPLVKAQITDSSSDLGRGNIKLYLDGVRKRSFEYDAISDLVTWETPRLDWGRHQVRIVATDAHDAFSSKRWSFKVVR